MMKISHCAKSVQCNLQLTRLQLFPNYLNTHEVEQQIQLESRDELNNLITNTAPQKHNWREILKKRAASPVQIIWLM